MTYIYSESNLIDPETRKAVFDRDGMLCHYCGCDLIPHAVNQYSPAAVKAAERLGIPRRGEWVKKVNHHRGTIDHIHPRKKGGEDNLENFTASCAFDNSRRGHVDYEEYKKLVAGVISAGEHPCT